MPENMVGKPLAIRVSSARVASRLYVDGQALAQSGQPGTTRITLDIEVSNFQNGSSSSLNLSVILGRWLLDLKQRSDGTAGDAGLVDGCVRVHADLEDGCLVLAVEDDGVGFSEEQLRAIASGRFEQLTEDRIGVGLNNVRLRLWKQYQVRLSISNREQGGAKVEMKIPYK